MFYLLSKVLYGLVSPLSWVMYALLWAWFSRRYRRRAVGVAFVVLYLISNEFLGGVLMRWWEGRPVSLAGQPPFDVAIILTGGIVGSGSPSREVYSFGSTADRLLQPLLLYRRGQVRTLLISGGEARLFGNDYFPDEGQVAADFLKNLGVNPAAVLREPNSRNTYENAQFTARLLRQRFPRGRFLLVTTAYHLPRAAACFRKAGLVVTPYPVDFRAGPPHVTWGMFWPSEEALERLNRLVHEWVGFVMYRAAGYC